jgi:uncharacterized Tic20 family protein
MSDAPVPLYPQHDIIPTNSEERNLAMLAHVLQFFTGFIGPLIIFLVKRDSKFVRYHSLMALFWQLMVTGLWMIGIVIVMVGLFSTVVAQPQGVPGTPANAPPPMFLLLFPMLWGGWFLIWVCNLILGIVYGIKAHDGKWDGYPVIKVWAAKAAGL